MDFFSKCDQIRNFLQIWSHLLKKSLIEYLIFCGVAEKKTVYIDILMTSWEVDRKNIQPLEYEVEEPA